MNLTDSSRQLVRHAIRQALLPYIASGFRGVSCIAEGADSIFAEVVLEAGGELLVILPAADYRDRKVKPHYAAKFDYLISRARHVDIMPFEVSNRQAYETANSALLGKADLLIAVWDGRPAVDQGGTAAVVEDARKLGVAVEVVWPDGAARE